MTVDPILPLSISIAEGERTYALFLGSGISREAGIPTGGEILNNTIKLLYKMENDLEEADDNAAEEWFKGSKYEDWGYSEILESLYPSQEDRRNFLENFFLGKHPTDAHNIIAEMVEKNLVKCIITTNFDRLMEEALKNKGISFDVVASKNDLDDLKPREHSNCRILKLHGDYQKSNIKNTVNELEKLETELEEELNDILNKYGVVTVGYSGSDNGVMKCFENRENPRYTLYWLARENLNDRVQELIRQQSGKEIIRDSADEFLKELIRKIEIFQTHETGETPEFIIQQIKECLQKNDSVSFLEILKNQIKSLRTKWDKIYNETDENFQEASEISNEEAMNVVMNGFKEFESLTDVITAIGMVLVEYNAKDFFKNLLDILKEIFELSDVIFEPRIGTSYSYRYATRYIPRAAVNNIFYCWGAIAIKKENFSALKELISLKIVINDLSFPEIESKEIWYNLLGENIATFDRNSVSIFEYLLDSYNYKEFLNEFFRSNLDFKMYLYQFSFVLNLYSLKKYDEITSLPSTRLNRESIRRFIIPLLFSVKIDINFNFEISKALDDIEVGPIEDIPTFINNYPERCEKLNSESQGIFTGSLPCDFFTR